MLNHRIPFGYIVRWVGADMDFESADWTHYYEAVSPSNRILGTFTNLNEAISATLLSALFPSN